jgi:D-sedoheptulose 7-phosphate isomerase
MTKDSQIQSEIIRQIEESIELKRQLKKQTLLLSTIANQIINAIQKGKKILIFGNGGSAADAQHIVAELAGKLYEERRPLPAIALTTNTSSLTAIANDFGFDESFKRQVTGLCQPGDVVIGISTSGHSPNVIKAIQEAKRLKAVTVAFTGQKGPLTALADYAICIPSNDTARIQEAHIVVGHIICSIVEMAIVEGEKSNQE